MEARGRHRRKIELEWRIRLLNNRHNGHGIGNRWWSCVNFFHIITGMVWTPAEVPEVPVVTGIGVVPWTIPSIGISIWWIWSG
jgi:hypothetical protein